MCVKGAYTLSPSLSLRLSLLILYFSWAHLDSFQLQFSLGHLGIRRISLHASGIILLHLVFYRGLRFFR